MQPELKDDSAGLPVLGRGQVILAALLLLPPQLALDGDGAPREVNAVPHQAEDFPFPHPGVEGNLIDIFVAMPLDGVQEEHDLILTQRLDLLLLDTGEFTAVGGVGADAAALDLGRLLERLVQDAVDVPDGLG